MQSISTAVAAAAAGIRRATKLPASSKQPKASRVQFGPVIFRPATLFVPGSARPKFKLDAAFDQGGKQPIVLGGAVSNPSPAFIKLHMRRSFLHCSGDLLLLHDVCTCHVQAAMHYLQ